MNEKPAPIPTRREFAQALTVLAAIASAPAAAAAQEIVLAPDAKAYTAAWDTVIRYRFGKNLSEQQIARLRVSLANRRFSADLLKKVDLDNSDDPIVAFRADLP